MSENTENKPQDLIKETAVHSVDKQDKATPKPDELKSDKLNSEAGKSTKEYGGRKDGLDPTRFGDWEKNGRCIDF